MKVGQPTPYCWYWLLYRVMWPETSFWLVNPEPCKLRRLFRQATRTTLFRWVGIGSRDLSKIYHNSRPKRFPAVCRARAMWLIDRYIMVQPHPGLWHTSRLLLTSQLRGGGGRGGGAGFRSLHVREELCPGRGPCSGEKCLHTVHTLSYAEWRNNNAREGKIFCLIN